jgi:hypothetical protein
MDSLAYPLFTLISTGVRAYFNNQMNNAYDNFVNSIGVIALLVETVYVLHYGYLIAFQKSTDSVPEPSIKDLFYHLVIVAMVLLLIKKDSGALDAFMALRQMVIGSLTGEFSTKAGQQVFINLGLVNVAYSVSNVMNVPFVIEDAQKFGDTAMTLSIIGENSPQITGGIMLLINEIITALGVALFPLALYSTLYKITDSFFGTWFDTMLSATVQIATLVVLTKILAVITPIFLGFLLVVNGISSKAPIGSWYVPEFQRSFIEAGFGMLMTMLLVWVPAQAATFSGKMVNSGSTKGNLGNVMTNDDLVKVDRPNPKQPSQSARDSQATPAASNQNPSASSRAR